MSQSGAKTIGFIDDDADFLELLEDKTRERGLQAKGTCDPDECLSWVENGEIDELVADLRMREDGLTVIENARQRRAIRASILTGFAPTRREEYRASDLGVKIHFKPHLKELLDQIAGAPDLVGALGPFVRPGEGTARLMLEAQGLLVSWLKARTDRDGQTIYYGGKTYSMNDLISEIEARTDVGEAHLRLFIQVIQKAMGL